MLLPENYPEWSEYDTYSNLLHFEEDLGHLTGTVLIFLEAPGAIAELGAFSQIPSLRDRLAVVVTTDRHPAKSFISLGPLKYLEGVDEASVCVVENVEAPAFSSQIPLVMGTIDHTMTKLHPRQDFDKSAKGHHLLLALDLVTTLGVVDFPTLQELFSYFGVDLRDARLRQVLFTLAKAQLMGSGKLGGKYWYWPVHRNQRWVSYRAKDGSAFNRPRLISRLHRWRETSDFPAHRAYEWALRGGPK
jgi:hypothetical protein